ncbi:MAG: IS200/IS605 family transposase [Melioribacteraceae bacterium]|nr:IS200/IS605 family transposase [Melioribacteraceae bacterium]MCO6472357.1 IS200/IS605 family transposase [Melioribacteraceae bacterium]MDD3557994.1 IS200/IS605 family transposase [Melioribacteraceae bacterium]
MSWVRVWLHIVFTTKNREPILSSHIRKNIFQHIKENAAQKDIWIDSINRYKEHVHCLLSLNKDQPISKVIKLIKGESSFWVNKNNLTKTKFTWQDDYWVVSVSESHLKSVREYIHNQEEHHRYKPFSEEIDEFMKKYGWSYTQKQGG